MHKIKHIIETNIFFFFILAAAVFLLYGKSISFDFSHHDDDFLITDNISYLSSVSNIPKLFTTSCYYSKEMSYYRPVLNLSFVPEAFFFGTNPSVYHFVNILLFLCSLFCIYIFLIKLNINRVILKFLLIIAAVHPVFMSCAVWIPARNDTLLLIFICLSFIYFKDFLLCGKNIYAFICLLFFVLALFTKESSLFFLPLYIIFGYCFNLKYDKKILLKLILPVFAVLIFYFYLRKISVSFPDVRISAEFIFSYFYNCAFGICKYISVLLSPDYIPVMLYKSGFNLKDVSLSVFAAVILCIMLYKKVVTAKLFLFSVSWIFLSLSATFALPDYVYLNHRLIVALPGILLVSVLFAEYMLNRFLVLKKYILTAFVIVFVSFFYASFLQEDRYENKFSYWTSAYVDSPGYHGSIYWMYRLCFETGDIEGAKKYLGKLIHMPVYFSDLALIYMYENNFDEAEKLFLKSVEAGKNKAQSYRNLSVIYFKRDNNLHKAVECAEHAFYDNDFDTGYAFYLAELYETGHIYDKAENIYNKIIQFDKGNALCLYKISMLYEMKGDIQKAKEFAGKAFDADRNNQEYKQLYSRLNE